MILIIYTWGELRCVDTVLIVYWCEMKKLGALILINPLTTPNLHLEQIVVLPENVGTSPHHGINFLICTVFESGVLFRWIHVLNKCRNTRSLTPSCVKCIRPI